MCCGLLELLWRIIVSVFRLALTKEESIMEIDALIMLLVSLNLIEENGEHENDEPIFDDFDNLIFPDVPEHRVGEHPVGENFHPEDPVPPPRISVLPELISSMSEVPIIIYFSSARNI